MLLEFQNFFFLDSNNNYFALQYPFKSIQNYNTYIDLKGYCNAKQ